MTRTILCTSFKVKRSKVRVTGRLGQTHKMCHIFRTIRPKNLKVVVWMEDVDLPTQALKQASAMTSKVRGQNHKITWYV